MQRLAANLAATASALSFASHTALSEQNQYLFKENERLRTDSTELASLLERTKKLYGDLHDTYERLLKNNESESSRMLTSLKDRKSVSASVMKS